MAKPFGPLLRAAAQFAGLAKTITRGTTVQRIKDATYRLREAQDRLNHEVDRAQIVGYPHIQRPYRDGQIGWVTDCEFALQKLKHLASELVYEISNRPISVSLSCRPPGMSQQEFRTPQNLHHDAQQQLHRLLDSMSAIQRELLHLSRHLVGNAQMEVTTDLAPGATSTPPNTQGESDRHNRGNAGPPLTEAELAAARSAAWKLFADAKAQHRDVKQRELLETLKLATGRKTFTPTLMHRVCKTEWQEFRRWADPLISGRKSEVYSERAGEITQSADRKECDPAKRAEIVDEFRQRLMDCALNETEREKYRKMPDSQIIELTATIESQQMDDESKPAKKDRRQAPRHARARRRR